MNLLNVDDKTVTEVARFQYDSQRPLLHCVRDTHIYIYIYHIISHGLSKNYIFGQLITTCYDCYAF